MKHPRRFTAFLLAALAASALAQDAVSLKRSPKVGDAASYKLDSTMSLEGLGDGTFAATMNQKITKVADNGDYTIEEKTNAKANFGGQEIPIPDSTETQTRSALGVLLDVQSDGADDSRKSVGFRMDALQGFHPSDKAVKVGDTWSFEVKADAKNDNTGTKVDYKVEGAEDMGKHHVLKIHGTGKESGGGDATSDVIYFVDKESGLMIKAEGSLKHAQVGAPAPVDMKFTMTLVE